MQRMKEKLLSNTMLSCLVIFVILTAVHGFEAIVIRMDETVLAENFINKVFGIIVTPLHNLIDGDIGIAGFVGLSVGYIVLAGIMGIKWGLMRELTGNLYAGMADHFFNNCIATNLLHITTETGTDEMLLVRVLAAQLISFAVVLIVYNKSKKGDKYER